MELPLMSHSKFIERVDKYQADNMTEAQRKGKFMGSILKFTINWVCRLSYWVSEFSPTNKMYLFFGISLKRDVNRRAL